MRGSNFFNNENAAKDTAKHTTNVEIYEGNKSFIPITDNNFLLIDNPHGAWKAKIKKLDFAKVLRDIVLEQTRYAIRIARIQPIIITTLW